MFGPGLLGTLGDQHRKQRRILNPVFSSAHMRGMSMFTIYFDKSTHFDVPPQSRRSMMSPTSFELPLLIESETDLEKLPFVV